MDDNFIKILQTLQIDYDTLKAVDAAIQEKMRKEEINKRVIEAFGEPVPYIKNGKDYFRISFRKDGRQVSKTAKTREEVIKKCFLLLEQKPSTLREVYWDFIEVRKQDPTKSSETIHYDEKTWNRYLDKHHLSNMDITKITAHDMLDFFKDITGRGVIDRKAFNKAKTLLNLIYDYAIIEGIVNSNVARCTPTGGLRFKVKKSQRDEVYRSDDVKKLTDYLKTQEQTIYTLAVRLHFCFCMRIGELRALTWDDYDEKAGIMRIWHEMVQDKDGTKNRANMDVPHTKNHLESGERIVPVSEEAKAILEELKKINGNKKYILQATQNAKFPVSTGNFNDHLRKYCINAGVSYYSSHKARFYGITELYEAGVPEHIIQYIAGHASVSMTQHYNRPDYTKEIDKRIWESIFGYKG